MDPQGTYHHPEMNWADANVEAAAEALPRLRQEPPRWFGVSDSPRLRTRREPGVQKLTPSSIAFVCVRFSMAMAATASR
jgi:hypothetical protein